jgi:tetrahydromethanopterin S-methyltransferase subunit G
MQDMGGFNGNNSHNNGNTIKYIFAIPILFGIVTGIIFIAIIVNIGQYSY